jgi:uncharacterized protein YxjI
MIYLMKQKLFAFGNDYVIRDENGREMFLVDGKAWSLGQQLSFQDMSGNELAFIRQQLLAWGPTYEIYRNGQVQAIVKKALFTLFRHRFTVDVEGPDDLVAEGNFLDYEYTFSRGERQVATVSRQFFTLGDTYGIETADGEDDILILASAVVIDLATEKD